MTGLAFLLDGTGEAETKRSCLAALNAQCEAEDIIFVVGGPSPESYLPQEVLSGHSPRYVDTAASTLWERVQAIHFPADQVVVSLGRSIPCPGFADQARASMDAREVAAVGGPVLRLTGVRTDHSFPNRGLLPKLSYLGRSVGYFGAPTPGTRMVGEAEFLSLHNVVVRWNMAKQGFGGIAGPDGTQDYWAPPAASTLGRVLFDSDLMVEQHLAPAALLVDQCDPELLALAHTRLVLGRLGGLRRALALAGWLLVGTRGNPGLLVAPYAARTVAGRARLLPCLKGRVWALRLGLGSYGTSWRAGA